MKVGILTINDNDNYGNRLQNYAVQEFLKKQKVEVETVRNEVGVPLEKNSIYHHFFRRTIRKINRIITNKFLGKKNIENRKNAFINFTNTYIKNSSFIIKPDNIPENLNDRYDYFIAGSDQVWNPHWRLKNIDILSFAEDRKRISFSASIGANDMPESKKDLFATELKKFKSISVREDRAKEIVEELTGRKDVEILLDPTMLLTKNDWDKISNKPKFEIPKKYILSYFLDGCSKKITKEIKRFAFFI